MPLFGWAATNYSHPPSSSSSKALMPNGVQILIGFIFGRFDMFSDYGFITFRLWIESCYFKSVSKIVNQIELKQSIFASGHRILAQHFTCYSTKRYSFLPRQRSERTLREFSLHFKGKTSKGAMHIKNSKLNQ